MNDLDEKEQKHVRTALRYLRRRVGTWAAVADALHLSHKTIEPVLAGRRPVTASIALRTARLAGASVDDLLSGIFLPGACPRCGYVPDFADESTVTEDGPRLEPRVGLELVP